MHAVIAGEGGQPEIGDDEPLRRHLVVFVADRTRRIRHHHIDAGRRIADRLADRKRGGDVGVERLLDRELALPHLRAALLGEASDVEAIERTLEVAADHGVEEAAVADAVDLDRNRLGVDAHHRDATLAGARQHIGAARETHRRLAVPHIDIELGTLRQRLVHGRGDAGAQRNAVALAVLEAFHADLPLVDRERRPVLARNRDERRKISAPPRQVFGELEAGARGSRVRVDGVVEQPEAMVLAHALVLQAHVSDLAEVERDAHGIERRAPELAIGIAARDHQQRFRLLGWHARAQIADIGGGRRALEQGRALAIIAGPDLQHGLGEPQPVAAILGRDCCDLAQQLQPIAEIVAPKGCVGLAPQLRDRLRHRSGFRLDLRFELDRRVRQVVALERLLGGRRDRERQRQ